VTRARPMAMDTVGLQRTIRTERDGAGDQGGIGTGIEAAPVLEGQSGALAMARSM
jgi:hypothetical protein